MKIYFAPEFARQIENSSKRVQNIVKVIAGYIERHELSEIQTHPNIRTERLEQDLHRITLKEVRILASLNSDSTGTYWIFAQLESPNPQKSSRVMIKCPITNKAIFTGIAMSEQSFESSTLEGNSVRCPYCGQEHVWSKSDAFLLEE